jgi:hypothetical protein
VEGGCKEEGGDAEDIAAWAAAGVRRRESQRVAQDIQKGRKKKKEKGIKKKWRYRIGWDKTMCMGHIYLATREQA